ncbi:MAG: hypothetical protein R2838_07000 [Caldilineaceae bacterium]
MALDPWQANLPPLDLLENIPDLIAHYYEVKPDPNARAEQVSFGTSGHRGTSTDGSFNEDHILAIAQAICDYRRSMNIAGPLMLGMDTHAPPSPRLLGHRGLCGQQMWTFTSRRACYTPTPVISHAILTWNQEHPGVQADGGDHAVPQPAADGGFKYNPLRRPGRYRHDRVDPEPPTPFWRGI